MQNIKGKLENKVAIVTGSARGIGRATAKKLADEGARVIVMDRLQQAGQAVVDEIVQAGGQAVYRAVELTDLSSIDAAFASVIKDFGTVDILVNNAGEADPMSYQGMLDIDGDLYDRIMFINVKAPFRLCQLAIPYMEKTGEGSIVNVGSAASTGAGRGPFVYTISKHAILGLTREIELCHGRNGVRANCILPGPVYTALTQKEFDNPEHPLSKFIAMSPAGRPAQPEEIASVIVFLTTKDSWFIQGSGVAVDGGTTLC
ncbi:MAG: SDR family oxidoreductase [Firmicutes bacterium]|nr:SDR family oxidoreductase [Bacillota bacterium]